MSTPRYDWWPYVKGMIRRYPELCRREADLHTTAVTPNYSGAPGGHGGHTDPVANAALRSLPEVNRRELDAVRIVSEWDATHHADGTLYTGEEETGHGNHNL